MNQTARHIFLIPGILITGAHLFPLASQVVGEEIGARGSVPLSEERTIIGTVRGEHAFTFEPVKKQISVKRWRTGSEIWRIGTKKAPIEMKIFGDRAIATFEESPDSICVYSYSLDKGDARKTGYKNGFPFFTVRMADSNHVLLFDTTRAALIRLSDSRRLALFAFDREPIVFSNAELFRDTLRVILGLGRNKLRLLEITRLDGNPREDFQPNLGIGESILPGFSFDDQLVFHEGSLYWLSDNPKGKLRVGTLAKGKYTFSLIGQTDFRCELFGFAEGKPLLLSDRKRNLVFMGFSRHLK